MKNLMLVINVLLVVAVGWLYFDFYGKKSEKKVVQTVVNNTKSTAGNAPIAYVELDSLNEKITYIKEKRRALEAEQKVIESEWQRSMRSLEAQRDNFVKRGDAITQAEAEKFQGQLIEQQQKIEANKQNAAQRLSEKSYVFMDDIQSKLKTFLKEYNKDQRYMYILTSGTGLDYMIYRDSTLNITDDVIRGMNEKMSSLKK